MTTATPPRDFTALGDLSTLRAAPAPFIGQSSGGSTRPGPWKRTTRHCRVTISTSRFQCSINDAGHTTNVGGCPGAQPVAIVAIVVTVFPSPISSASIPPRTPPFTVWAGNGSDLAALQAAPDNILPIEAVSPATSPAVFTLPEELQGEPAVFLQVTD